MFIVTKSHKKILAFCHLNVIHIRTFATCIYFAPNWRYLHLDEGIFTGWLGLRTTRIPSAMPAVA